jgi:hypothetical protein
VASGADLSRHFSPGKLVAFPTPKDPTPPGALYFEPSAITSPTYGDFGNSGPYIAKLHGFGSVEEDISITKNFTITEKVHAFIRAEFFDAFNRHYFANPITSIGNPSFGYVPSVTSSMSGAPARQGQLDLRISW